MFTLFTEWAAKQAEDSGVFRRLAELPKYSYQNNIFILFLARVKSIGKQTGLGSSLRSLHTNAGFERFQRPIPWVDI